MEAACAHSLGIRRHVKELKENLSRDTICGQSFDATDAAFRTGCVLYNLVMGFRETVFLTSWFNRYARFGI